MTILISETYSSIWSQNRFEAQLIRSILTRDCINLERILCDNRNAITTLKPQKIIECIGLLCQAGTDGKLVTTSEAKEHSPYEVMYILGKYFESLSRLTNGVLDEAQVIRAAKKDDAISAFVLGVNADKESWIASRCSQ